jgi:hypothetical protein
VTDIQTGENCMLKRIYLIEFCKYENGSYFCMNISASKIFMIMFPCLNIPPESVEENKDNNIKNYNYMAQTIRVTM